MSVGAFGVLACMRICVWTSKKPEAAAGSVGAAVAANQAGRLQIPSLFHSTLQTTYTSASNNNPAKPRLTPAPTPTFMSHSLRCAPSGHSRSCTAAAGPSTPVSEKWKWVSRPSLETSSNRYEVLMERQAMWSQLPEFITIQTEAGGGGGRGGQGSLGKRVAWNVHV